MRARCGNCPNLLPRYRPTLQLVPQGTGLHLTNSLDIGTHYAITLREWKRQWEEKKDQVGHPLTLPPRGTTSGEGSLTTLNASQRHDRSSSWATASVSGESTYFISPTVRRGSMAR